MVPGHNRMRRYPRVVVPNHISPTSTLGVGFLHDDALAEASSLFFVADVHLRSHMLLVTCSRSALAASQCHCKNSNHHESILMARRCPSGSLICFGNCAVEKAKNERCSFKRLIRPRKMNISPSVASTVILRSRREFRSFVHRSNTDWHLLS